MMSSCHHTRRRADGERRPGLNLADCPELTRVTRSDSAWAAFAIGSHPYVVTRAVGVLLALALSACTSGPGPVDDKPYIETIQTIRADKDRFLRTAKDSPIPTDARATFPGLPYYEIKPEFRLPSFLTERKGEAPVIIEMQTTGTQTDKMRRVGTLGFAIGAAQYTLTAFADVNDRTMERLFVPFGDITNGSETYKGGRYMNLQRTATGLYDIDFNQAFHPYCVYNPTWICPVPPRENRLPVAIQAGERLSPDHK